MKILRKDFSRSSSKNDNKPLEDNLKSTFKDKAGDAANKWLARNRSLVLRQTPFWAQSLAALMIGLGGIVVCGGILFRIDEVVTVTGQLKSIGGTVEVMTPAGGRVAEVFFNDGDYVEKGELLIRFDTTQAASDKKLLTAQIDYENKQLKTALLTLKSQKNTLEGRSDVLSKRLNTQLLMLNEMKILVEQGGFQRMQYLERQDQVYGLEKQIADLEEQSDRIALESERLSLENRKSIDGLRSQLVKVDLQLQYQNVVSPVSGIIFDPRIRKESVIAGGERILSIVPQEGLYAEVFVPNKDIGYIQLDQEAKVRVDAFPFSRYGDIPAKVSQIAADALAPTPERSFYSFPVKLDLERSTLKSDNMPIPLKPGMSITTNLKLRDKRVISIVSDIFVDQTDSVRSIRQQ
tara:strand:- start:4089 stop:5306 length:1218 start_codon:yes stop_codon:yes gene_type:complete